VIQTPESGVEEVLPYVLSNAPRGQEGSGYER
jgi:hypothetical protein